MTSKNSLNGKINAMAAGCGNAIRYVSLEEYKGSRAVSVHPAAVRSPVKDYSPVVEYIRGPDGLNGPAGW